MSRRLATMGALALAASLAVMPAADAAETVILDTAGYWRSHNTLARPEMQTSEGLKKMPACWDSGDKPPRQAIQLRAWYAGILADTPPPPAAWFEPDFDDSGWVRGTGYRFCRTPFLARLCLRGKFTVTDPAKAGDLQLTVGYHGGVAVRVNGREIARQHLAAGGNLAEPYPVEAFVGADGKLITTRGDEPMWGKTKPDDDTAKRIGGRVRRLTAKIPREALRPGLNAVAIELVRAPYHQVVEEQLAASDNHGKHQVPDLSWNTCELKEIRLAASADGLVAQVPRPRGFQVWNSDFMNVDYDVDFGSAAEPLRPIMLSGPRNGVGSGKVVVGSDRPIKGLKAAVQDLKGAGGAIPSAQIRIRYGLPWGGPATGLVGQDCNELLPFAAEPEALMALHESPPPEVPVREAKVTPRCLKFDGQPSPVPGAVASVWVTVNIPRQAAPGAYTGQLTVTAEGMAPVNVPITLRVVGWTLPDPGQWQTWVELIQSPDTLSLEYDLPLWSDRHWQMIEQSLGFVAEVGSGVLFCPLIAESNAGNAESMVRWIKQGENQYQFDFSIFDQYLDLAVKRLGKPQVVVFNAWDRYLMRKDSGGRGFQVDGGLRTAKEGPLVTVVAGGKTENVMLPSYTEPAAKALWKPLFDQLRERMQKRGLEPAMHLGMASDFWATKEEMEVFNEVSGNLPWANAGHYVRKDLYDGLVKFGYQSSYFGTQFGYAKSLFGWKSPNFHADFERVPLDNYPLARWRLVAEQCITGNVRGIGRLGADTWHAVKDKRGQRANRAWERWPGGNWGYLNCDSATLAPGPDGPVATPRFEALRENVQECEAIILLEKALSEPAMKAKLDPELAKRCEAAMDERRQCSWRAVGLWHIGPNHSHQATSWRGRSSPAGQLWFQGSGWQQRGEQLYALAGEVAASLGQHGRVGR